jgi:membrane protein YqaA with SNARE-associated domain
MLRRIYDWTIGLAGHRRALPALALISFAESSFFPVPPDVLLIPMVLAARNKAWRIAAVCTLSSVAGALLGYAIGYFVFESLGRPLLDFYGAADAFAEFRDAYKELGWWIVVGGGVTPFPYKVVTILSGVAGLDPVTFVGASLLSRGLRFFLEAALLWYVGPPIRAFIEKNLALLATVFFVLLFGGFILVVYVF